MQTKKYSTILVYVNVFSRFSCYICGESVVKDTYLKQELELKRLITAQLLYSPLESQYNNKTAWSHWIIKSTQEISHLRP